MWCRTLTRVATIPSVNPIELARRWKRSLLGFVVAVGALCFVCDAWVARVSDGHCFAEVETVPEAPVALVLGCSEFLPDGRRNLYFTRRIAAAAELFHAGKVRHLIVSGDNSTVEYDEPTAMKKALARAGVPEHSISCDFAGFRTLDSVVRANAIFGQSRMIIVSQRFHGQRAVFLARRHGLEAFAFDASAVGARPVRRPACAKRWRASRPCSMSRSSTRSPNSLGQRSTSRVRRRHTIRAERTLASEPARHFALGVNAKFLATIVKLPTVSRSIVPRTTTVSR